MFAGRGGVAVGLLKPRVKLLRCADFLAVELSPVVMGVGQERQVLLVPLFVWERSHLTRTIVLIVETRSVLVDQCRQ